MTTETMTIHEALSELKTLDDRIQKLISNSTFVTTNKHSNDKISGITIAEYKDRIKSCYQKIVDLINRRNALKRAVVLSNAKTEITVNGITYTVAEAIDMKNHGMENKENLLQKLRTQYAKCNYDLTANSSTVIEERADKYVQSYLQQQGKDTKSAVKETETIQQLRKFYIADNTYDLIDPLKVVDLMESLENEISAFETKVDGLLSVSNAKTEITISY